MPLDRGVAAGQVVEQLAYRRAVGVDLARAADRLAQDWGHPDCAQATASSIVVAVAARAGMAQNCS